MFAFAHRSLAALFLLPIASSAAITDPRIDSIFPPALPFWAAPQVIDLNTDSRPDLFIPAQGTYGSVWLRNLGGRIFAETAMVCRSREGDGSHSLVDLDGDGREDILSVSAIRGLNFQTLPAINAINGSFTAPHRETLPLDSARNWLAADLDGQPGAEIIAERSANDGSTTTSLTVYRRDASGQWAQWSTTPMQIMYGGQGDQISACDADGDGDIDFEINSDSFAYLFERRSNGPDAGIPSYAVHQLADLEMRWADLDGDGILDHYSDRDGAFHYQMSHAISGSLVIDPAIQPSIPFPGSQDGWILKAVEPAPHGPALLIFAQDNGDAPFAVRQVYTVRFGRWAIGSIAEVQVPRDSDSYPQITNIADLDGDGFDDVVFMRPEVSPFFGPVKTTRLAVAWGTATGFEAPAWIQPLQTRGQRPVAVDFDHDGDMDLIVSTDDGSLPVVLLNDGHGNFGEKRILQGLAPPPGFPADTTILIDGAADLNGDHRLDLVISYSSLSEFKNATTTAIGNSDGSFSVTPLPPGALDFSTDIFSFGGDFADWDGDGDLDLMGSSGWRENLGGGLAEEWHPLLGGLLTFDFLGNPTSLSDFTHGDLDGDGHPDWISMVHSDGAGPVPAEQSKTAIGFTDAAGAIVQIVTLPLKIATTDFLGNPTTVGNGWVIDLNQDGLNDFLYREASGSDFLGNSLTALRYKLNPGGGSHDLANWTTFTLPFDPGGDLFRGDFDGDGSFEWCGKYGYIKPTPAGPAVSSYYDFTQETQMGQFSKIVAMADFDGDGDLDSLWGGYESELTLVRNLRVDERSGVSRFLRSQGIRGINSNPDADPDGDGRTNAEEILTGSNPLLADTAPLGWLTPRLAKTGEGLQISWRRRSDAQSLGLGYALEESNDLKTWSAVDTSRASWQTGADASWQEATVSLPASAAVRFYRVRGSDGGELR